MPIEKVGEHVRRLKKNLNMLRKLLYQIHDRSAMSSHFQNEADQKYLRETRIKLVRLREYILKITIKLIKETDETLKWIDEQTEN